MLLKDQIKGCQHLGLPVTDIERSKRWYTELLGAEVLHEKTFLDSGEEVKVAFLSISGFVIEMYQQSDEKVAEVRERGHGHIDHIALDVADIDTIHERLKKTDVTIVEGPRVLPFWQNGVKYITVLGPDNEKVEFNQYL